MTLSIVTRAYKSSELRNLIEKLNSNSEIDKEIVAVCNINDYNIDSDKLIIENYNRVQAKIVGIKNADFDKILILDSDQIPEDGLLSELDGSKEEMIIIPEKSVNNGITSRCLDDWRYRNEGLARKRTTPYIPVIPRFYNREYLLRAIDRLPENIDKIVNHEDSIFYYEVFKETRNIGFSKKYIYNYDPNFFKLMYKAILYGKNQHYINELEIESDILDLLNKLDRNTLNIKELRLGKGYIIQVLRGGAYEFGRIIG